MTAGGAQNLASRSGTGSRPVTLRAMLAADCSPALSPAQKHLVHVLALHADNTTGRGLTGQATLGLYMGVSARTVRRLMAELETLWAASQSPVGLLRSKRWLSSDAYHLVVRADAPLSLRVNRPTMAAHDRSPLANEAATHDRLTPNEAVTSGLQSSEVSLQREPQRKTSGLKLPRAGASGAPPHASARAEPTEAQARSARRAAAARR